MTEELHARKGTVDNVSVYDGIHSIAPRADNSTSDVKSGEYQEMVPQNWRD